LIETLCRMGGDGIEAGGGSFLSNLVWHPRLLPFVFLSPSVCSSQSDMICKFCRRCTHGIARERLAFMMAGFTLTCNEVPRQLDTLILLAWYMMAKVMVEARRTNKSEVC
jgi:hypothetical protein